MSLFPSARLALTLIGPRGLEVEADVQEVSLPSLDGRLGILPGHRPLVLALGRGEIVYRDEARESRLKIRGGYADIRPEAVLAFVEPSNDEDEPSPS